MTTAVDQLYNACMENSQGRDSAVSWVAAMTEEEKSALDSIIHLFYGNTLSDRYPRNCLEDLKLVITHADAKQICSKTPYVVTAPMMTSMTLLGSRLYVHNVFTGYCTDASRHSGQLAFKVYDHFVDARRDYDILRHVHERVRNPFLITAVDQPVAIPRNRWMLPMPCVGPSVSDIYGAHSSFLFEHPRPLDVLFDLVMTSAVVLLQLHKCGFYMLDLKLGHFLVTVVNQQHARTSQRRQLVVCDVDTVRDQNEIWTSPTKFQSSFSTVDGKITTVEHTKYTPVDDVRSITQLLADLLSLNAPRWSENDDKLDSDLDAEIYPCPMLANGIRPCLAYSKCSVVERLLNLPLHCDTAGQLIRVTKWLYDQPRTHPRPTVDSHDFFSVYDEYLDALALAQQSPTRTSVTALFFNWPTRPVDLILVYASTLLD